MPNLQTHITNFPPKVFGQIKLSQMLYFTYMIIYKKFEKPELSLLFSIKMTNKNDTIPYSVFWTYSLP